MCKSRAKKREDSIESINQSKEYNIILFDKSTGEIENGRNSFRTKSEGEILEGNV